MATQKSKSKTAKKSQDVLIETTSKSDDILRFEIKRSHFWALVAPVAFLLGIAVGYLVWGNTPVAVASGTQAQPQTGTQPQTQAQAPAQTGDIGSQIAGLQRYEISISEADYVVGPADAPITIVEFADFQCPYCVRHFQETMPPLMEQYGDQVRFVFKNFPLRTIHPDADAAAQAALCAGEQGMFWEYHDLLFGGAQGLGRAAYESYAQELGLDVVALNVCLDDARYAEQVQADYELGIELGVSSTPTFFINGIALVGAYPFDTFASIIDYELGNQ